MRTNKKHLKAAFFTILFILIYWGLNIFGDNFPETIRAIEKYLIIGVAAFFLYLIIYSMIEDLKS